MKKDFVIGDIHGMYFDLVRLLKAVGFDPARDTITVIGDCIDWGTHSNEVLRYFMELKRHYPFNIILLKGNHEDMCVQAFRKGAVDMTIWLSCGGNATLESFQRKIDEEVIQFIDSLPLFHETENLSLSTAESVPPCRLPSRTLMNCCGTEPPRLTISARPLLRDFPFMTM